MHPVFELARRYAVRVEFADLGDWGVDELRSEYDPDERAIRINLRVIENLPLAEIGDFIAFSIGHELYHHREHCGEIARLPTRPEREIAANEFARALLSNSAANF